MMGVAWKVAGESYATILRLCNTAEVRSAIRAACEPKRKRKEKP
jgi:hypothetical protein